MLSCLLMDQLPLNIAPRLSYSADNFLVHDGVRPVVELCEGLLARNGFRILFVPGPARSGKTHLSIKLADLCACSGRYPRLLDGRELAARLHQDRCADASEVYLVDDAHEYLNSVPPGQSGLFVSFVERLRSAGSMLVLLSACEIDELPCDEHIRSRLLAGRSPALRAPAPEYLPQLVDLMARQRGLKLSPRKIEYLIRRLDRSIREIDEYLERVSYLASLFGKAVKLPLLSDAL